jgi:hypothetical protein
MSHKSLQPDTQAKRVINMGAFFAARPRCKKPGFAGLRFAPASSGCPKGQPCGGLLRNPSNPLRAQGRQTVLRQEHLQNRVSDFAGLLFTACKKIAANPLRGQRLFAVLQANLLKTPCPRTASI